MISIILTIILFCAFLVVGKAINKYVVGIRLEYFYENVIIDFAMGFGIGSYYIFIIGLLGCLNGVMIISFLGISLLLFPIVYRNEFKNVGHFQIRLKTMIRDVKRIFNESSINFVLIFIIGVVFVQFISGLITSLAPPTNADAMYYHFTPIKKYLEANKIYPLFDNSWSFVPQFIEMTYAYPFVIGNAIVPALLNSLFLLGILALIINISKKMFDLKTGVIACGIFCSMPMVFYLSANPKPDFGYAFFAFLSFYLFYIGIKLKKVNYFILSGIFVGFACVSKTVGAIVVVANIVLLFTFSLRKKNSVSIKEFICFASSFGVIAIVVASPWFIKNWVWTNNFTPVAGVDASRIGGAIGLYKIVLEFIISPWEINTNIMKYVDHTNLIGPLYLCFIPFIFFVTCEKTKVTLRNFLIWALTVYFFWFFVSKCSVGPRVRYLLPALPIFAILGASVVRHINLHWKKKLRIFVNVVLCGAILFNLIACLVYNYQFMPVALGMYDKGKFLSEKTWHYRDLMWINRNLTKEDKVLAFMTLTYYLDIPYIIGSESLFDYKTYKDHHGFLNELYDKEITHILWVDDQTINNRANNEEFRTVLNKVLRDYSDIVYENKESVLGYRFHSTNTVPIYLYKIHYPF